MGPPSENNPGLSIRSKLSISWHKACNIFPNDALTLEKNPLIPSLAFEADRGDEACESHRAAVEEGWTLTREAVVVTSVDKNISDQIKYCLHGGP